jgi:hypothetical protein
MAAAKGLFLLDRFLEQFAGGKFGNFAGRNINVFARPGIAALASGAVNDLETAEAGETYGLSGGKGIFQGRDNGVQGIFRLSLGGQAGLGMDFVNKFSFGHEIFPLVALAGGIPAELRVFALCALTSLRGSQKPCQQQIYSEALPYCSLQYFDFETPRSALTAKK